MIDVVKRTNSLGYAETVYRSNVSVYQTHKSGHVRAHADGGVAFMQGDHWYLGVGTSVATLLVNSGRHSFLSDDESRCWFNRQPGWIHGFSCGNLELQPLVHWQEDTVTYGLFVDPSDGPYLTFPWRSDYLDDPENEHSPRELGYTGAGWFCEPRPSTTNPRPNTHWLNRDGTEISDLGIHMIHPCGRNDRIVYGEWFGGNSYVVFARVINRVLVIDKKIVLNDHKWVRKASFGHGAVTDSHCVFSVWDDEPRAGKPDGRWGADIGIVVVDLSDYSHRVVWRGEQKRENNWRKRLRPGISWDGSCVSYTETNQDTGLLQVVAVDIAQVESTCEKKLAKALDENEHLKAELAAYKAREKATQDIWCAA